MNRKHFVHPLLSPIGFRKDGRPIYPIAGADGTQAGNPVITRLEAQRREQEDFIEGVLNRVEAESRDLVDAEKRNLESAKERIKEIDEQLKPLLEWEETRAAHRSTSSRPSAPASTGSPEARGTDGRPVGLGARTEPRSHEYRSAGEIIADAMRASSRQGDEQAEARLESNGLTLEGHGLSRAVAHQLTSDNPGILPDPIVGEIVSDVDAARPFISSVGVKPLTGIPGKVFHRPVVTQHTQVGKQSAEKTELPSRKLLIDDVDFTKDTYGGVLNVSRQDIDWTSPSAWDAILTDMQEQYAIVTENAAADAFATAVTAETDTVVVDSAAPTMENYLSGLYAAAALAYQGSGRLPDAIWCSLDMWASMGPLIDSLKATNGGDGGGDSSVSSFAGNLLRVPRVVVPSFASGTLIVGVKGRTEVYEERIGFLQAVEPSLLGVEIAYGGYMASGTVKPGAFAKVTFTETP